MPARRSIAALALAAGLAIGIPPGSTEASGIVVDTLDDAVDPLGELLVTNDGRCSFREAVEAANTDTAVGGCPAGSGADTITFSTAGTIQLAYAGPAIVADVAIEGDGSITIRGARASFPTGEPIVHGAFQVDGRTRASVVGLQLDGGGIYNGGDLTLSDVTIFGGLASGNGGGIANQIGAHLQVRDSTIRENTALNAGGGIHNLGTLEVIDSTITGNAATGGGPTGRGIGSGGGIAIEAGTVTIARSTISANAAELRGGAICIKCDSRGTPGLDAAITIVDTTIADNSAGNGGGIYIASGTLEIIAVTASSNHSTAAPAGGIVRAGGDVTLGSSIVAGNSPEDIDLPGAIAIADSLVGVPETLALADILDPAGLADNGGPTQTIALVPSADNPAVDAAPTASCSDPPVDGLDQRGLPRPVGAGCDLGAFELQEPIERPTDAPSPTVADRSAEPSVAASASPAPEATDSDPADDALPLALVGLLVLLVVVVGGLVAIVVRRAGRGA